MTTTTTIIIIIAITTITITITIIITCLYILPAAASRMAREEEQRRNARQRTKSESHSRVRYPGARVRPPEAAAPTSSPLQASTPAAIPAAAVSAKTALALAMEGIASRVVPTTSAPGSRRNSMDTNEVSLRASPRGRGSAFLGRHSSVESDRVDLERMSEAERAPPGMELPAMAKRPPMRRQKSTASQVRVLPTPLPTPITPAPPNLARTATSTHTVPHTMVCPLPPPFFFF